MRNVEPKDLIGKRIVKVDAFTNMVKLTFADGSCLSLWAETAVNTPAGSIPGIFVDDEDQD